MNSTRSDFDDDPILAIESATRDSHRRRQQVERRLGSTVETGRPYLALAAIVFGLCVTLLLPHSHNVTGVDFLAMTDVAREQQTTIVSRVYLWLLTVGVIGGSIVTLVTQKWVAAFIAWAAGGIASVEGLLSIWLRNSGRSADPDVESYLGAGIGLYLGLILTVSAFLTLSFLVWRHSEEHRKFEAQIRDPDSIDV